MTTSITLLYLVDSVMFCVLGYLAVSVWQYAVHFVAYLLGLEDAFSFTYTFI